MFLREMIAYRGEYQLQSEKLSPKEGESSNSWNAWKIKRGNNQLVAWALFVMEGCLLFYSFNPIRAASVYLEVGGWPSNHRQKNIYIRSRLGYSTLAYKRTWLSTIFFEWEMVGVWICYKSNSQKTFQILSNGSNINQITSFELRPREREERKKKLHLQFQQCSDWFQ